MWNLPFTYEWFLLLFDGKGVFEGEYAQKNNEKYS